MSQINKVERDHSLRQASRLDDLRPATKKPISKATPQIKDKSAIADQTAVIDAAQRAGTAVINQARSLSGSSDKSEDQEAIDKLQASARNATEQTALAVKESLKRQIRKKKPDIKTNIRSIQKADRIRKSAIQASEIAAKSATEATKQSVIASQKVISARKAEQVAKKSAEWVKRIVKGIIEGTKKLFSALGAASVPLMVILVLACLFGGIAASSFGIFFAGDQSGQKTHSIQEVVLKINAEYNDTIETIKKKIPHDELTTEGYLAPWPDVLSVYAVYVTTRTEGATDVVHITDNNVNVLRDIFWKMNSVTYSTKKITEKKKVPVLDEKGKQQKDAEGNPIYTEKKVTKTILNIKMSHKTAEQQATSLSFNVTQLAEMRELLDVRNASLWAQLLKCVGSGSNELVNLALSQLGNKGGEKYWKWAGSKKRIAWCALFVSWCADKTGLRAAGKIPYFSFVGDGVHWFKTKGKWIKGSDVNNSNYDKLVQPGMIIFFDWEENGKRDGHGDHVGIVTKVSGGRIYTVEGNNDDAVRESSYPANSKSILGFGIIG